MSVSKGRRRLVNRHFQAADVAQARCGEAAATSVVYICSAVAGEEPQYLSASMPAGVSLSIHPAQMRNHNAAELPVSNEHTVLVDYFDENVTLRDVEVAWI